MPDEVTRKALVLRYCRYLNEGDVDAAVALFAEDVRFEDPVGAPPIVGRAALRGHLARAVRDQVRESPGTPVASLDGQHVVVPATITLCPPGVPPGKRVRSNLISVVRVGADGLIQHVRVLRGRTDLSLVDAAAGGG